MNCMEKARRIIRDSFHLNIYIAQESTTGVLETKSEKLFTYIFSFVRKLPLKTGKA